MTEQERLKMRKVDSICRALQHYINSYAAVPAFPENEKHREMYLKGYEDNLKDLKDLLNGA